MEENIRTESEELQKELDRPLLISLEGVDKEVSNKIFTVLETALKYEFKDQKFALVDATKCTGLAIGITQIIKENTLNISTLLLLVSTILSEAKMIIDEKLKEGYNVICTSYVTDAVCNLSQFIPVENIANILISASLVQYIDSEIVVFSPVPETETTTLEKYHEYITAAMDTDDPEITTSYFRIDSSMEDVDNAIENVIDILRARLENSEEIKDFAKKLFSEEEQSAEDMEIDQQQ